ncbi:MAG TPA: DciA family protein [Planctomycetota bacterium]|nr:DciA family protein [Planctomycetota bacterium]
MPDNPNNPLPLGDILKKIVRKGGAQKKKLAGRALAQKTLSEALGPQAAHASVASVKTGIVTVDTDSPALFQELEAFHKQRLIDAFRAEGLNIIELRVRLAKNR